MLGRQALGIVAGGLWLLTAACGSGGGGAGGGGAAGSTADPSPQAGTGAGLHTGTDAGLQTGTDPSPQTGTGASLETGTGAVIEGTPVSRGPTYYLSPSGNDASAGTSPAEPWKTLKKAARVLQAGDTLLLRGGSYVSDHFQPVNSGSPDDPITITAYPNELPVITGKPTFDTYFNILGKSWLIIDGLHFADTTGGTQIHTDDASHLVIRNCTFNNHGGGTMVNIGRGRYNRVEYNTFDTTGNPAGAGSGDHVFVRGSDYNLIQNNYFKKAGHYAIDFINYDAETSDHNIFRDNTIEQRWGGGVGVIRGSTHTLVERNKIYSSGEGVTAFPKVGIQVAAEKNIVRNNLIVRTSASPYRDSGMAVFAYTFSGIRQNARHNRIYNNLIYKSGRSAVDLNQKDGSVNSQNTFVNNVLYHNRVGGPSEKFWPAGNYYITVETFHALANNKWPSFPNGNHFHNNLILHADSAGDHPDEDPLVFYDQDNWGRSLAWVQDRYPAYVSNNISRNPLFVDAERDDFRLRAGSPAIDAGAHLARTTAAGTGTTTVPVGDAYFFSDGFGLVDGDAIQIGSNAPVRVTAVDYDAKTLAVSAPVSFVSGEYVDLPYAGSAPDIGAFEHR
jgi:hypothetical protein